MRRPLALLCLAAAVASPVLAQGNRGSCGLDAMLAPTAGLGFAYYVADGLSLRPSVGLGYSGYNGVFANAGAQLRWEIIADSRWSPYVSASALYSHNGVALATTSPTGTTGKANPGSRSQPYSVQSTIAQPNPGSVYQPYSVQSNTGQFGIGAGLRRSLSRSLALFAEGRLVYTTYPMGTTSTGWPTTQVNDNSRAEAVLGLTYFFR